ncbi:MAG: hypothetical protein WC389_21025 [Lutibacter sp.]
MKNLEIKWATKPRIEIEKEFGVYVAFYDKLEIETYGNSKRKAKINLDNAIISYCLSLADKGLLEKRLNEKEIGFEFHQGNLCIIL